MSNEQEGLGYTGNNVWTTCSYGWTTGNTTANQAFPVQIDMSSYSNTLVEKDKRIQELEDELKSLKKALWATIKAMQVSTELVTEPLGKRIGPPPEDVEDA